MDMDETLIVPKNGGTFSDDWVFKSGVLTKLIDLIIDTNATRVTILTNQRGVDHGYKKPYDVMNKVQDVADNLSIVFVSTNMHIEVDFKIAMTYNSDYSKPNVHESFFEYIKPEECIMIGDASGLIRDVPCNSHELTLINNVIRSYENEPEEIILNDEHFCKKNNRWYKQVEDFSDSDKKFAEKYKIKYFDIDEPWRV